MVGEVLQWGVLATLALLVLGLFRQISTTIPPALRSYSGGPEIGRKVPRELLEGMAQSGVRNGSLDGTLVAFVTEDCPGCRNLLSSLERAGSNNPERSIVLVAQEPSPRFSDALATLSVPIVADPSGIIWNSCGVTSTPLLIRLSANGRVAANAVTHDVQQVG